MKHSRKANFLKPGMSTTEFMVVILIFSVIMATLLFYAPHQHRGSDRSAVILNIRNCQQAMRGHQNIHNLKPGDPFTREDLEEYMKFPANYQTEDGMVFFAPGNQITESGGDPPLNSRHLWLKMSAPETVDYIGKYGFDSLEDVADW